MSPMRVVLYARVSTHDQQTLAMQIDAMRTCATRRGGTGTDASEAWALMPQSTAPSARSCSQRLGNASSRSCWCGSSTVGVSGQHHCDWVNARSNGTSAYLRLKPVNGAPWYGLVHGTHTLWYVPWYAFIREELKSSLDQGWDAWLHGRRRM